MWTRKELKQKAKQVVKKNYWTAIVVCFLIALLTGEFGTSTVGIWQSNDSMDPNYVVNNEGRYNIITPDENTADRTETGEDVLSKGRIYETLNDTRAESI